MTLAVAGAAVAGAAVAAGAYALACYAVYDHLSRTTGECWPDDLGNTPAAYVTRPGYDQAVADAHRMPPPEDVEFPSRDPRDPGLRLRAWWVPAADPAAPAVVVVHGLKSSRREANVLLPAGMLHGHGYSILLVDLRNHGDSDDDGLRIAAGTKEYRDVLGAWDWLVARGVPPERIGLLGVSFGAGAVLNAGGEERRVAAVWVDSPFADIDVALRHYLAIHGYPGWLAPGALLAARVVAGHDLTSRSPLAEIPAYAGRRLGIVHGDLDTVTLPAFAEALREAAVRAGVDLGEYWTVTGAGHTEAVYLRSAEYETRLVRFFDSALRG